MITSVIERAVLSLHYPGQNIFPDCFTFKAHGIEFQASVIGAKEEENALIAIALLACGGNVSAVDVYNVLRSKEAKLPACLMKNGHFLHNMMMAEPWLHITVPRKKSN